MLTQTCSPYYDCLMKTSIDSNYKSIVNVLCQLQINVKVKSTYVIRHLGRWEIKNMHPWSHPFCFARNI